MPKRHPKYLMRYNGAGLPRVSSKSDSAADNQPTTFAWACSLMLPSTPITDLTRSNPMSTEPSVRQGASEAMAASFGSCAALGDRFVQSSLGGVGERGSVRRFPLFKLQTAGVAYTSRPCTADAGRFVRCALARRLACARGLLGLN